MTDLRTELHRVADGVGPVVAPTGDLVRRGHRRRAVLSVSGTAGLVVVVALAAVLLPPRLRSSRPLQSAGSTAAQLAHGTWQTLPEVPLLPSPGETATWARDRLVVLSGGVTSSPTTTQAATYEPGPRRWTVSASVQLGCSHWQPVWTGRLLFVWPGSTDCYDTVLPVRLRAQALDPARGTWTGVPTAPLSAGPALTTQVVEHDGRVLVVQVVDRHVEAAVFDPVTWTWTRDDPVLPPDQSPFTLQALDAPDGPLLWVLSDVKHVGGRVSVQQLNDRWVDRSAQWKSGFVDHPVRAGGTVLLEKTQSLCSSCQGGIFQGPELLVDASSLTATAVPDDVLRPFFASPGVWTGRALASLPYGQLQVTDLSAGIRRPGPVSAQKLHLPVWSGSELYALGLDGRTLLRLTPASR